MSQLHARLYDAKTGDLVHEDVMVLLAAVPPVGAVLVHEGQHYRAVGVEYALDGSLVVAVSRQEAPAYGTRLPPSAEEIASSEWREVGASLHRRAWSVASDAPREPIATVTVMGTGGRRWESRDPATVAAVKQLLERSQEEQSEPEVRGFCSPDDER